MCILEVGEECCKVLINPYFLSSLPSKSLSFFTYLQLYQILNLNSLFI